MDSGAGGVANVRPAAKSGPVHCHRYSALRGLAEDIGNGAQLHGI